MKTPKRYQNKPVPLMPEDNVPDYDRLEIWWQRAKRKNRVKQLKRTIHKYKTGKGLFRAYSYLMSAYAVMLKIGELSKDASIAECRGHLLYINSIMHNLHCERERVLRRIEIIVDKACERAGKENQQ